MGRKGSAAQRHDRSWTQAIIPAAAWSGWLQPQEPLQHEVRTELLHIAAQAIRDIKIFPLFGGLAVLLAWQWAPHGLLFFWYGATLAPSLLALPLQRRLASLPRDATYLGKALPPLLAIELTAQILWMLYVPLCWQNGNIPNNAFLQLFTLASLTSSVRLYSPCAALQFASLSVYIVVAVLFRLHSGGDMDFAFPVLETAYATLLVCYTIHQNRMEAENARQRIIIQTMAAKIARARDEAVQANSAKSAFLASISHKIRTPMNTVIGFSDMIRRSALGPVSPPQYRAYADDIYKSAQHLLSLINDVRDLSKIEAGTHELTDSAIHIDNMLQDVSRLTAPLAAARNITVQIQAPPGILLTADERAVRQILLNFLSNAIRFSPSGAEVILMACQSAAGLDLGVKDHGVGMDAQDMRKALQPYGQADRGHQNGATPAEGTGLGLPIAKALIEAHGASFHIQSSPGAGTTVWGRFPVSRLSKKS